MPRSTGLDPARLPDIATLRRRAKALAMLDAILSPEWEYRYYSFDARWYEGEEMASMRNGSGDDWFLLFGPFGAAIKGMAHESSLAGDPALTAAVKSQVPETFASFLNEPAFSMDELSYCYWKGAEDLSWQKVEHGNTLATGVDDGSTEFLLPLIEPASAYVDFAREYYEIEVPLSAVELIYEQGVLTESLVKSLNPDLSFAEAKVFAAEIGYPCA